MLSHRTYERRPRRTCSTFHLTSSYFSNRLVDYLKQAYPCYAFKAAVGELTGAFKSGSQTVSL